MLPGGHDGRITFRAGLDLVAKLDTLVSISDTNDPYAPSIKKRRRGLTFGRLMLTMAASMLASRNFMRDLDNLRKDAAAQDLRAVLGMPSVATFLALGKRLGPNLPTRPRPGERHLFRLGVPLAAKRFWGP